jgi:phosphoribosylanthranilate isomerase
LNPENVSEGIRIFQPDIVDVSSGVEGQFGKDKEKIEAFAHAVRSTL